MIPRQDVYFSEFDFAEDVLDFSGKPLEYWKNMRQIWRQTHQHNTDDLIDGSREYSHQELIDLYNHEIYNAYGYAELAQRIYVIDSHLNSSDRPWMRKIYDEFSLGKKILDFGCGDLTNAICFYDIGYKTTAVDLPIDWIKFTEYRCKKYGIDIDFRYTYTNDSFLTNSDEFDIIFCHEVLEHVKDPDKVLEYLVQHLKIGGIAFLTVTFTSGAFHLKENHQKFGFDGNVHYHPDWMRVLDNLHLKSVGNDFYKRSVDHERLS